MYISFVMLEVKKNNKTQHDNLNKPPIKQKNDQKIYPTPDKESEVCLQKIHLSININNFDKIISVSQSQYHIFD